MATIPLTPVNQLVETVLALEHDDESCRYLRGLVAATEGQALSRSQVRNSLHLLRVYADEIWDDLLFESGVGLLPVETLVEQILVELGRRYQEHHRAIG